MKDISGQALFNSVILTIAQIDSQNLHLTWVKNIQRGFVSASELNYRVRINAAEFLSYQ